MTAPAPLQRDAPQGLLRTLDVLIVDSDASARTHLRKLISASGIPCEVDEAQNRADAVIRVRARDFDIVFLEVASWSAMAFTSFRPLGLARRSHMRSRRRSTAMPSSPSTFGPSDISLAKLAEPSEASISLSRMRCFPIQTSTPRAPIRIDVLLSPQYFALNGATTHATRYFKS